MVVAEFTNLVYSFMGNYAPRASTPFVCSMVNDLLFSASFRGGSLALMSFLDHVGVEIAIFKLF